MARRKRGGTEVGGGGGVPCGDVRCQHAGRCVATDAGRACACGGAWGGARCDHYVGHDHACDRACRPPALCLWADSSANDKDSGMTTYCACPLGSECAPAPPPHPPADSAGVQSGGAWVAALLGVLTLAALVLAALFLVHRRRHGLFVHARLPDNVEISNPMYLAGEDEDPAPPAAPLRPPAHNARHTRTNGGGNHFANPVYESMYAPQQSAPVEEHATLLSEAGGDSPPPPAERAALL